MARSKKWGTTRDNTMFTITRDEAFSGIHALSIENRDLLFSQFWMANPNDECLYTERRTCLRSPLTSICRFCAPPSCLASQILPGCPSISDTFAYSNVLDSAVTNAGSLLQTYALCFHDMFNLHPRLSHAHFRGCRRDRQRLPG